MSSQAVCALSIDLESFVHRTSYRQLGYMLDGSFRKRLDNRYIRSATVRILHLLGRWHRKVTFFVVSEIFDWYPDVIKRIAEEGHEVAYHTHTHARIRRCQDLLTELRLSERFMREFEPVGFRAPELSLDARLLRVLADHGFEYDSSSFGSLDASVMASGVWEVPVSTLRLLKSSSRITLPGDMTRALLSMELPLGSGFFMSALGPAARFIPHLLALQNKVPVLFVHPWQIVAHDINLPVHENKARKRAALTLYSRTCLRSFEYVLAHFQTVCLKDLATTLGASGKEKLHV